MYHCSTPELFKRYAKISAFFRCCIQLFSLVYNFPSFAVAKTTLNTWFDFSFIILTFVQQFHIDTFASQMNNKENQAMINLVINVSKLICSVLANVRWYAMYLIIYCLFLFLKLTGRDVAKDFPNFDTINLPLWHN